MSRKMEPHSDMSPDLREKGSFLDTTLRPSHWDEYIGQRAIKDNMAVLLRAAQQRNQSPEHILLYGPPGLGKTTLAHLVAHELNTQMKVTSGPAIEKVSDLASLLTNLSPNDILFIDEVHRLPKTVEEILYPAMEAGSLDIIIGKGPSARSIQLELPPFTLVAATTRIALVSSPLRSRFSGGVFRLEFYAEDDIRAIITRSAGLLEIPLDEDAAGEIARRSRFTPRIANYLLKRARDVAQVNNQTLTHAIACQAFDMLGIDTAGLTQSDRDVLTTIIEKFNGGPVGLSTIAASLSEDIATIEEYNEPYLMQIGFIERTPRGRVATPQAYAHLGFPVPDSPR